MARSRRTLVRMVDEDWSIKNNWGLAVTCFEDTNVGDSVTPHAIVTAVNPHPLLYNRSKLNSINFAKTIQIHHKKGLKKAMKMITHIALHDATVDIFTIGLVRFSEVFF